MHMLLGHEIAAALEENASWQLCMVVNCDMIVMSSSANVYVGTFPICTAAFSILYKIAVLQYYNVRQREDNYNRSVCSIVFHESRVSTKEGGP